MFLSDIGLESGVLAGPRLNSLSPNVKVPKYILWKNQKNLYL